jgi:Domain of Unknown Function (DUF1080)
MTEADTFLSFFFEIWVSNITPIIYSMRILYFCLALALAQMACQTQKSQDTASASTDTSAMAGTDLFAEGNFAQWHVYKKDTVTGWEINQGEIHTRGGNGDLVSNVPYENFTLNFDWKASKAGNSGVFYMVQDDPKNIAETYFSGIEYQIIDGENWPDKLEAGQYPGAAYDLYPPLVAAAKPVGEWNSGRIVVNNGHVAHFLNGKKTAEYDWNSTDFLEKVAKSKFKDWPFAKKYKGHIALQDHGQEVWFRNVTIQIP